MNLVLYVFWLQVRQGPTVLSIGADEDCLATLSPSTVTVAVGDGSILTALLSQKAFHFENKSAWMTILFEGRAALSLREGL